MTNSFEEYYQPYLNFGYVRLIDVMGNDADIEMAARLSYGQGTRPVSKTRHLIRYLWRHEHTSPFEMGELKFSLKMPIFVARQFIRHRTASVNEYSGRYSEMINEFYIPDEDRLRLQSASNKQGSEDSDDLEPYKKGAILDLIVNHTISSYDIYQQILGTGLTRELSRIILPTSNFTEMVWKIDLKNFLHFVKLRMDEHAQEEIRKLANLMYEMVKDFFPLTCEAFEDYTLNSIKLSRVEREIIQRCLNKELLLDEIDASELSNREKIELAAKVGDL